MSFIRKDFAPTDLDELSITDAADRKIISAALKMPVVGTSPPSPAPAPVPKVKPRPKPTVRRAPAARSDSASKPATPAPAEKSLTLTKASLGNLLADMGADLDAMGESNVDIPEPDSIADPVAAAAAAREKEEDEFERLVQGQGLLGALGFGEPEPEPEPAPAPRARGLVLAADDTDTDPAAPESSTDPEPAAPVSYAAMASPATRPKKAKESEQQAATRRAVRDLLRNDDVELWKAPYSDEEGNCTITRAVAEKYADELGKSAESVYAALDKLRHSALKRLKLQGFDGLPSTYADAN